MPGRHIRCDGGLSVAPLDVVSIPLRGAAREPGQPENRVVESGKTWRRHGRFPNPAALFEALDPVDSLWGHSCGDRNERVSSALPTSRSLVLIRPESFRVVEVRSSWDGAIKPRADVRFKGKDYRLSITDDVFLKSWRASKGQGGGSAIGCGGDRCLLCISLGVPFHGYRYKLVAGVIPLSSAGGA